MITSLKTYFLYILICAIFEKDIKLSRKNILHDLSYVINMSDLVAIGEKMSTIDSEYSLEKEFH